MRTKSPILLSVRSFILGERTRVWTLREERRRRTPFDPENRLPKSSLCPSSGPFGLGESLVENGHTTGDEVEGVYLEVKFTYYLWKSNFSGQDPTNFVVVSKCVGKHNFPLGL